MGWGEGGFEVRGGRVVAGWGGGMLEGRDVKRVVLEILNLVFFRKGWLLGLIGYVRSVPENVFGRGSWGVICTVDVLFLCAL